MGRHHLKEAVALAKGANRALTPDALSDAEAREMLAWYTELEKLGAYGKAAIGSDELDGNGED